MIKNILQISIALVLMTSSIAYSKTVLFGEAWPNSYISSGGTPLGAFALIARHFAVTEADYP